MYNDPNQPPYSQHGPQNQYPPYGTPTNNPYSGPPSNNPYAPPPSESFQQPYAPPPQVPYNIPPPQPKKSRRWLWITLSILGGILLLSCVGCVIAGGAIGNLAGPAFQKGFQSTLAADNYYSALKSKDYAKAYSYVDPAQFKLNGESVTQEQFQTKAEAVDTQRGMITTSSSGNGDYTQSDSVTETMTVTRSGKPYIVQLVLKDMGNNTWKIVSADGI